MKRSFTVAAVSKKRRKRPPVPTVSEAKPCSGKSSLNLRVSCIRGSRNFLVDDSQAAGQP
jgi:hypothetical protein